MLSWGLGVWVREERGQKDRRGVRAEKGPREAGLEKAVVSLPRAYGLACHRMPSAEMAARARTCVPYPAWPPLYYRRTSEERGLRGPLPP